MQYAFIHGHGLEDGRRIREYVVEMGCGMDRVSNNCSERSVLMSLVEPLLLADYTVMSYNSRGVGRSSGWRSFTGFSEAEDLKGLVQWVIQQHPTVTSIVLLVGLFILVQGVHVLNEALPP